MKTLLLLPVVGTVVAATLGACATSVRAPQSAQSCLLGTWTGTGANDIAQTFEFRADNTATWSMIGANFSGSFELDYTIQDQPVPHPFALGLFNDGPLAGRSPFGIVEFIGDDQFRLDLEPGSGGIAPGDSAGELSRPSEFTDQTVTYTRVVSKAP